MAALTPVDALGITVVTCGSRVALAPGLSSRACRTRPSAPQPQQADRADWLYQSSERLAQQSNTRLKLSFSHDHHQVAALCLEGVKLPLAQQAAQLLISGTDASASPGP